MTVVNPAQPSDVSLIADMAEEMDRFYGATKFDPMDVRIRQINDALFDNPPAAYALLAWVDTRAVGFASYSFLWPAVGLTKSLYLKELYVVESSRRHGVGRILMQSIIDVAVKTNCSRVEWTTDRDNSGAQRFYEAITRPDSSKIFYRLEGDELQKHE